MGSNADELALPPQGFARVVAWFDVVFLALGRPDGGWARGAPLTRAGGDSAITLRCWSR
jgi:hypothetical protein